MGDVPERIWAWTWEVDRHRGQFSDKYEGAGAEYLRADIAAAREAELRAEVERLKDANREAAMQSLADLGQAQEALDRAIAAEAEAARLRALLDEARNVLSWLDAKATMKPSARDAVRATLAKIGGQ